MDHQAGSRADNHPTFEAKPVSSATMTMSSASTSLVWRQPLSANAMGVHHGPFSTLGAAAGPYNLPQLMTLHESSPPPPNKHNPMSSFNPMYSHEHSLTLSKAPNNMSAFEPLSHPHHEISLHTPSTSHLHILRESSYHDDDLIPAHPFPASLPESFRELLLQESRVPDSEHLSIPNTENYALQQPPVDGSMGTLMAGMQHYYHALEGLSMHYNGALNQVLASDNDHQRTNVHIKDHEINMQIPRQTNGIDTLLRSKAVDLMNMLNTCSNTTPSATTPPQRVLGDNYYPTNPRISQGSGDNFGNGEKIKVTVRNNIRSNRNFYVHTKPKNSVFDHHEKVRFDAGSSTICFGQGASCGPGAPIDELIGDMDCTQLVVEERNGIFSSSTQNHHNNHSKRRPSTITPSKLAHLLPGSVGLARPKKASRHPLGPALNTNLKPRARQGSANDPQSIAARQRRERINTRLKALQELVPNGSKVDLVTMLEKAINYVKFLQLQLKVLTDDDFWSNAQQFIRHESNGIHEKALIIEGGSSPESSNILPKA